MKKLNVCRMYKDKFTIVVEYPDFSSSQTDADFPSVYEYYRVDSEEELLNSLASEDIFLIEDINTIYYANKDVTEKYLTFNLSKGYYELRDSTYLLKEN